MWDLWDQINLTADTEQQNTLFQRVLDIWLEELPMVGIVGEFPGLFIVKNGLRAFKPGYKMPLSNPLKHGGFIPAQTYYWEEPSEH